MRQIKKNSYKLSKLYLSMGMSAFLAPTLSYAATQSLTTYSSGSYKYANFSTYYDLFGSISSSNYLVTGSGTSLTAHYSSSNTSLSGYPSGVFAVGNGVASGDTDAYLQIENGATVTAEQAVYIGGEDNLDSYVTVTGSNSELTAPQIINGYSSGGGTNTLNIEDGATVNSNDVYTGLNSDGTINVDGDGSTLNVSSGQNASGSTFAQLSVGHNQHNGTLNVTNGGVVNLTGGALLSIGGNGSDDTTADTTDTTDTVNIKSGGVINARLVAVGNNTVSSNSTVNITGDNSALNASEIYDNADNGTSIINVSDGGKVKTDSLILNAGTSGTGTFNLGTDGYLIIGGVNGISTAETGSNGYEFNLNGGTLDVSGSDLTSSINMNVNDDSTIDTNDLNASLSGILSGSGGLTKDGAGTLILSGKNTYSGKTNVSAGSLQAAADDTFSPNSDYNVTSGANLNLDSYSQTVSNLTNSGLVELSSNSNTGTTLTVNGDYVGNNGEFLLNTALGDDSSATDKLIVTGKASGTTSVEVNNANGSGAQTLEGIELIQTGSSTDDAFVQSGRIVAGAYDYHLQKGNSSQSRDSENNWYLTSSTTSTSGSGSSTSSGSDTSTSGTGSASSGSSRSTTTTPTTHTWRPEAASYTANLAAANTLFATRLHDRLGETQYTDALTGEKKVTSMWIRNVGGHNQFSMTDGQNKTTSNRYVLQLGGDVAQWSNNGLDRLHLGVMGGYGSQHSNTTNNLTGYHSKASIDGYSAGLYGTWYQNDSDKDNGLYVDSWAQYNWFDNYVDGEGLAGEKYRSSGVTASVESGYTFHAGSFTTLQGMNNDVYIQPKVQLTWFGVKANDHTEYNGTDVQGEGTDNLQTRLGTRLYLRGKSVLDKYTGREFEPFVEANWIYNSHQYGTRMNGVSDSMHGSRNIGELKAGVEAKLTSNVSLWGSIGQQLGENDYRDTQGIMGIKASF